MKFKIRFLQICLVLLFVGITNTLMAQGKKSPCPGELAGTLLETKYETWDTTWTIKERVLSSCPSCGPNGERKPVWARHPHTFDSMSVKVTEIWGCPTAMDPKGLTEQKAPDTPQVIVIKVEVPAAPVPCPTCCPADTAYYKFNPYFLLRYERIGGRLTNGIGGGLQWTRFSASKKDQNQSWWVENPISWYGGLTFLLGKKQESLIPTCDTCGIWSDENTGISLQSEAYFGGQRRVFQKQNVFGFVEGRYDWFNTEHSRNTFLGDEGISIRTGLKGEIPTPEKMVLVRSVNFSVGPEVVSYAKPNNDLTAGLGAFLEVSVTLGRRSESIRAAEKLRQDSIRQVRVAEKLRQDSIALDSFLLQHPDSIAIDTIALAADTAYQKEESKIWFITIKTMPFSKKAKVNKINKAKTELRTAQQDYNTTLQKAKNDEVTWPVLAKKIRQLEAAQKRLDRLEQRNKKSKKG